MRPPLAFVPIGIFRGYPGGHLGVPAIKTLVDRLSLHFEVNLATIGGDKGPALSRDEDIASIRRALKDGTHVVAMGWEATDALLALDGLKTVRSFTSIGFQPPAATVRAAGMTAVADAYENIVFSGAATSYPMLRFVFQDVDEARLREIQELLDRASSRAGVLQYYEWLNKVDLIAEAPSVAVPTLYLRSKLDMPGVHEIFQRLVPQAEVQKLDSNFPMNLLDSESANDPAERIVAFLRNLDAEAA
jgi:hypothetical protein